MPESSILPSSRASVHPSRYARSSPWRALRRMSFTSVRRHRWQVLRMLGTEVDLLAKRPVPFSASIGCWPRSDTRSVFPAARTTECSAGRKWIFAAFAPYIGIPMLATTAAWPSLRSTRVKQCGLAQPKTIARLYKPRLTHKRHELLSRATCDRSSTILAYSR